MMPVLSLLKDETYQNELSENTQVLILSQENDETIIILWTFSIVLYSAMM